jgi:hypothetical protein
MTGRTPQGRKLLRPCAECGKGTTAQFCNACRGVVSRRVRWADVLDHGARIARDYDEPPTLRQLFYRLVADGTLPNLDGYYRRLAGKTAEARRVGEFPSLTDNSSEVIRQTSFASPAQALGWLHGIYRRDRTEGQPWTVYLAVEKNALAGLLGAWFGEPLGIPVYPLGGYAKTERCEEIRRNVEAQGRPAVLITAGDFDPSGEDISRDFTERTGCWKRVHWVALGWQQVQDYELPENTDPEVMAKLRKDPRAKAFEREHGFLAQFELDALPPDVLRNMYRDVIDRYQDDDARAAVLEREAAERQQLRELLEGGER